MREGKSIGSFLFVFAGEGLTGFCSVYIIKGKENSHMKTDDIKGEYKTGRGGKRTAGEGKKVGAPFKLEGARRSQDILDEETIAILERMVAQGKAENRSEAIRIAVKSYKI